MFEAKLYSRGREEAAHPLQLLAALVGKSYGPHGRDILYRMGSEVTQTTTLVRTLAQGESTLPAASLVAEAIGDAQDGVKTAVLLAGSLVRYTMDLREGWDILLAAANTYLEKAAAAFDGNLPGGGVWLLGLQRPLNALHYTSPEVPVHLDALVRSLKVPFIKLVKNEGYDAYDVYAYIKSLMPNQFYSLHHFGLSGSIPGESPYADCPCFGLDVTDGKIKNLADAGIVIPLELGKQILHMTAEICKRV